MDKSTIEFASSGRKKLGGKWYATDVLANRLCFIHDGSGFYLKNGEKYAFEKGHIYLFPPKLDVKFENNTSEPLDYTYFDFIMHPGLALKNELKVSINKNVVLASAFEALVQVAKKIGDVCKADNAEKDIVRNYFESVLYFFNEVCPFEFVCDERINRVVEFIHKNYFKEINVNGLAESVFMETNHFIKVFKRHMGLSPYQYIKEYRFIVAHRLLKNGMKVGDVAKQTGYMSVSAFSNAYKKKFGVYPGTVYGMEKIRK